MRIFLATATENLVNNYTPFYQIHQLVIETGNTHTSNWYTPQENNKIKPLEITSDIAEKIKKMIIKSDLMIAEISIPSFGLGYHVCLAQMYKIPIICLYHSKYIKNISPTLKSMMNDKFSIYEYNDKNLEEIFKQALEKSIPKRTRFNFNLSQKDYQYLNILAKEHKKTKTDIIHDLISEKIGISKS